MGRQGRAQRRQRRKQLPDSCFTFLLIGRRERRQPERGDLGAGQIVGDAQSPLARLLCWRGVGFVTDECRIAVLGVAGPSAERQKNGGRQRDFNPRGYDPILHAAIPDEASEALHPVISARESGLEKGKDCEKRAGSSAAFRLGISGSRTRQSAGNQRAGRDFPRSGERGYQNIGL